MLTRTVLQRPILLLSGCLMVSHTGAQAVAPAPAPTWERIDTSASSDANGNQYFVDVASLRTTADVVEVSVLVELRDAQTPLGARDAVRSIIRPTHVDCAHRRLALTAIESFTGDRGTGQPVRFIDLARRPLQWQPVEPSSTNEALLEFVCERVHPTATALK